MFVLPNFLPASPQPRSRKSALPKLWLVSSLGLLCLAGVTGCQTSPPPAPKVQAAPITAVVALGRLQPEGEVIKISSPNAQDSRVNQILIREGQRVQAKQLLAILQGEDRRLADLRNAQADVRLRQAELVRLQQGEAKPSQLAAQQAVIARLQAQLKTETRQRQAEIARAKAALRNARLTYQRRTTLQREGAISQAELDTAQQELQTAQAELAAREAALEETLSTLPANIRQEQFRLRELREVRPIDLTIAREQLEKAKIAVVQAKASLEDVQIRAPVAGQILRINTQVGEQVNTSQGIMELARNQNMYVHAEISEIDIGRVQLGQQVEITSEYGGFSGMVQGRVTIISPQIGRRSLQEANTSSSGNPNVDNNARVVIVKIQINPADNSRVSTPPIILELQLSPTYKCASSYCSNPTAPPIKFPRSSP
jgi:HlyD family secretion protein